MRRPLLILAALLAVLIPAAPAWAHAELLSADPAKGTSLATAPTTVTLRFSEKLNPDFTTIVLSDAAQQRMPVSVPAIDGAQAKVTIDRPIGNGTYLLAYRVVSQDGHSVQGSYPFTVADPALPAAAVVSAPSAAEAQPAAASGGIPSGVLIGLAVLGVALAALAAYFYFAGRRRSTARP